MTSDQLFTRSETMRLTGKSGPTIDSYLKAGKLPNAFTVPKGKSRSWQIPLTDLVAAGLIDKVETQPDPGPEPVQLLLNDLQAVRERLTLAELELRLVSESLEEYKEREQQHKTVIKAFTNVLETKQAQEARRDLQEAQQAQQAKQAQESRRSWWQRRETKQTDNKTTWTPEQD